MTTNTRRLKIYEPALTPIGVLNSRPYMATSGSWFYFNGPQTWPNPEAAKWYGGRELKGFSGPLMIDIEHLLSKPEEREKDIAHLKQAINDYRSVFEGRIGLYSILPSNNYWAPQNRTGEAFASWRNENLSRRTGYDHLAHYVDICFPPLYDPYGQTRSLSEWEVFARNALHQASLYDKPIMPLLWPFAEQVPGQPYVGDARWEQQCRLVLTSVVKPEDYGLWNQKDKPWPTTAIAIASRIFN